MARERAVDLVLVAGDLYESAAPSAEAEQIVLRALLDLHDTGAKVVVIAGNHDNPGPLRGDPPVDGRARHHRARPRGAARSRRCARAHHRRGERAHIALLPFCSQRYAVRAAELMSQEASRTSACTRRRCAASSRAHRGLRGGAVNLVVAHGMVRGGQTGGGERDAPDRVRGLLDRRERVPRRRELRRARAPAPGPEDARWRADLVLGVADPGRLRRSRRGQARRDGRGRARAAGVRRADPAHHGEQLRTLTGTFAELQAIAGREDPADPWLRVRVTEPARRAWPTTCARCSATASSRCASTSRKRPTNARARNAAGRSPHELFAAYLEEQNIDDDRLGALFARCSTRSSAGEADPARGAGVRRSVSPPRSTSRASSCSRSSARPVRGSPP